MLVDATLLIQDVQLLCFTVVFGVLAFQRWNDPTRRWLWYSFLANAAGAVFDLTATHLPLWINHGLSLEMIPLSYALLNVSLVHFQRRSGKAIWISAAILVAAFAVFLAWRSDPIRVRSFAIADLTIALETSVTVILLWRGNEHPTRAPRLLMGAFLVYFVLVELTRTAVTFLLHVDPDAFSHPLEVISAVTYIVNTSLLPLAFIWMMNARLESELLQQSIIDPLTGVLNRRGLDQSLDRELARFRRYGESLTLVMLDLDHFKKLNDTHGHAAGDTVLREIARILSHRLRETDVVGRFGGEEFVLLFPHTDARESEPLLRHLCDCLREYSTSLPWQGARATASFGVTTTAGRSTVTPVELLREADIALYRAKENGRDQVCFYSPSDHGAEAPHLHPIG